MKNPFDEINKNPNLLLYSMLKDWDLRYDPKNQKFYYKTANPNEENIFKDYVKTQLQKIDVPKDVKESKTDAVDTFNEIIKGYEIQNQTKELFFKYKEKDLDKLNKNAADIYDLPENHNIFTKETLKIIGPKLFEDLEEEQDDDILSKLYFKWFYDVLIKKEG